MKREFYTPTQVSQILGIRLQTVYMFLETGKIPAMRIKTRWRIPIDMFDKWVETECWDQTMERSKRYADVG